MKKIETKDAVGHVICHDITIIVKDQIKDIAFRKGHIVREEDIPQLLSIGKDHLMCGRKKRECCTRMRRQRFWHLYAKAHI